jgi:hypothetical protein
LEKTLFIHLDKTKKSESSSLFKSAISSGVKKLGESGKIDFKEYYSIKVFILFILSEVRNFLSFPLICWWYGMEYVIMNRQTDGLRSDNL